MATLRGIDARIETDCVAGARDAIDRGDVGEHNRLLSLAAGRFNNRNAILLAHFSMDVAWSSISESAHAPVLSPPIESVNRLREILA